MILQMQIKYMLNEFVTTLENKIWANTMIFILRDALILLYVTENSRKLFLVTFKLDFAKFLQLADCLGNYFLKTQKENKQP